MLRHIYSTCFTLDYSREQKTIATTCTVDYQPCAPVVSFDFLVGVDPYNSLQLAYSLLVQPIVFYTQFCSQPTVSNIQPSLLYIQPHSQSSLLQFPSQPIVSYSNLQLQSPAIASFDLLVSVDSYNSLQLAYSLLVQPIVFYTQFPSQPPVSNSQPNLLQPHSQSSLLYSFLQ